MRQILLIIFILISFSLSATTSAVIQKEEVGITVDTQGRVVRHVSRIVAINTPAAYHAFGESFFVFNPQLQEIRIIRAATTHQDGRSFPAPENAFVLQSPYATAQSPDFSHIREQMVSHTALEPGCTVEFEYEIRDKKPHILALVEPMDGPFPIAFKRVTVKGIDADRIVVTGAVRSQGMGVFVVENQGPVVTDAGFVSRRGRSLVAIELDDPKNRYIQIFAQDVSTEVMADCLGIMKIAEAAISPEVVGRVADFVGERLATVDLHPLHTAYQLRPLSRVCASGYGTRLEKAFLTHAVLRHFRIDHRVALLTESLAGRPDFERPLAVVAGDCFVYPDAVRLAGKTVVTLYGDPLPVSKQKWVGVALRLREVKPGRFEGELTVETRFEKTEADTDWIPLQDSEAGEQDVPVHTLDKWVGKTQVTHTLEDGRLQLRLLGDLLSFQDLLKALQGTTQVTLSHGVDARLHVSVEFIKPKQIVCAPAGEVSTRFGSAHFFCGIEDRILTVASSLKIPAATFQRSDYANLQRLLVPVLSETHRSVFIEDK